MIDDDLLCSSPQLFLLICFIIFFVLVSQLKVLDLFTPPHQLQKPGFARHSATHYSSTIQHTIGQHNLWMQQQTQHITTHPLWNKTSVLLAKVHLLFALCPYSANVLLLGSGGRCWHLWGSHSSLLSTMNQLTLSNGHVSQSCILHWVSLFTVTVVEGGTITSAIQKDLHDESVWDLII